MIVINTSLPVQWWYYQGYSSLGSPHSSAPSHPSHSGSPGREDIIIIGFHIWAKSEIWYMKGWTDFPKNSKL